MNRFGIVGPWLFLFALSGLAAMQPVAGPAETLSTGAVLVQVTSDSDSGASLTNASGAKVEIAGAGTTSRDMANPAGAAVFVGYLDPLLSGKPTAAREWRTYR
jgi:hypothetical protein